MRKLFLLTWIICGIVSCNSQQTKNVTTSEFKNDEIGWSCLYPSDWKVLSKEEIAQIEGRGRAAMEKTVNIKIEQNNRNLLYLKKDPFNSFTSTIQPFDSISDGPYIETQTALFQVIIETYKNQGIQVDYKIDKEIIDGLEFKTLMTTIFTPDKKKVIMNQIMYDRLIDRKISITLSINYNNEKDKLALLSILETSKFTKRQ